MANKSLSILDLDGNIVPFSSLWKNVELPTPVLITWLRHYG